MLSLRSKVRSVALSITALLALVLSGIPSARADSQTDLTAKAEKAVNRFENTDPGMRTLLSTSAGYAVFPSIAKGGLIVGGAGGDGVLFENGQPVGKAKMSQATFGAQIGGQTYSEIIIFQDHPAIQRFKNNEVKFSGQASAVAAQSGASANAKFMDGVAVFTQTTGGLMLEAGIGGQRFEYTPFPGQS